MINPKELLFAVDENNQPIKPVERWKAHEDGTWHRNTHIWVINSQNQVLCHQRSVKKDFNPGKWEAFLGGHVLAAMSSEAGAVTELKEEAGINADPSALKLWKVWKYSEKERINNEFLYIYVYLWMDDDISLRLEKDEVDQIEWIDLKKLQNIIFQEPRWTNPPYLREFLDSFESSK